MDPRAFVATLVAVAPHERVADTAAALETLRSRSALRTILIVPGGDPQPEVVTVDDATIIEGLVPGYLNNAVASLRLSSLPSLAWWRGGDGAVLADLAGLVDRLVLDSPDARTDWAAAASLQDRAAVSELRWARLTRWRALMAQFFDVPDVRSALRSLSRLEIEAHHDLGQLFAAWMATRLPHGPALDVSIEPSSAGQPVESITLSGAKHRLHLRLLPSGRCVESTLDRDGTPATSRVVPLGDQSTAALLAEELRVRSRDAAYEQAARYLESQ